MIKGFRGIAAGLAPVLAAMLLCTLAAGSLGACSLAPEWAGGDPGQSLDLDGDQNYRMDAEVGEPLFLDFRDPAQGGYEVSGVYFDPELLDMSSFLTKPEDDGPGRLEYVFTPKAPGSAMIEIRVKAKDVPDAPIEVYKRIIVNIED